MRFRSLFTSRLHNTPHPYPIQLVHCSALPLVLPQLPQRPASRCYLLARANDGGSPPPPVAAAIGRRAAAAGLVLESYLWRRRLPECNGDTCAFKAVVQPSRVEAADVHNCYYRDGFFAVNERQMVLTNALSLVCVRARACMFACVRARTRARAHASVFVCRTVWPRLTRT